MKLSFRNRMLLTITAACLICTAAAILVSSGKLEDDGKEALVGKSRAILSRLEVGAGYVASMDTLDGVIAETVRKFPDGNVPKEQKLKVLKSVPIFAAFRIGESGAEKENYKFRIASDKPRKKENAATPEEVAVIEKFRADPKLEEFTETTADGKFIRVSRPVRISEQRGCLTCHGHPSHSPWKNGKDILGYDMEDLKDGELRGTFTIVSSLAPVQASVKASTREIVLWGIGVTFLALFLGFLIIRRPLAGINDIANGLSAAANEVAAMSTEIATASDQLSSGASQQAAALQETSASMEEVRSMVEKNTENAEHSTSTANESQATARKGEAVVQEMIQSIDEIDRSNNQIMAQIEESNRQISEIVKVITDIGEKTKVINDIVFQTKLLSFNASVEAARAGEHGKGFAVVAEEVGKLAQMSGSAAAEITEMLEGSVRKVDSIVNDTKTQVESLIQAGKGKVEAGTLVARRCGEVLREIVAGAQSVSQRVSEISAGSREQAKGVEEISKAVVQLEQVTQQNAASSQESAHAAERLSRQAEVLRSSVNSLMQTLSGSTEPAEGAAPRRAA